MSWSECGALLCALLIVAAIASIALDAWFAERRYRKHVRPNAMFDRDWK